MLKDVSPKIMLIVQNTLYTPKAFLGIQSPLAPLLHISYYCNQRRFSDDHPTLLTVFLQSGIVGLVLFALLLYKIFTKVIYHPVLFTASTGIMIYDLAGDILRRLPILILIFIILYTAQEASSAKTYDLKKQ